MPTRMTRTGRFAAVSALAALLLGACASNDADRGDVVDALTEAGVPASQAEECGDRFDREFTQDQLNEIADAESPTDEDLSEELWAEVETILDACITDGESAGGSSDEGETTETTEGSGSGDATESTDTTAAGEPSEETTTTGG